MISVGDAYGLLMHPFASVYGHLYHCGHDGPIIAGFHGLR